jgi:zeaxanthin glucosyltransferase
MHFGILSSPVPGHCIPLCALGRELASRGHRVTFFSILDAKELVERFGLDFCAIGESDFPAGAFTKEWGPFTARHGWRVVIGTVRLHVRLAAMMCQEVPMRATEIGIDALVIDQIQFQGRAIAEVTGLPFVTVACALTVHRGKKPCFPPPTETWNGSKVSAFSLVRNRIAWGFFDHFSRPILQTGNELLKRSGLPIVRSIEKSFSPLLQIVPMPRSLDWRFEFDDPAIVHYVGSLVSSRENCSGWRPNPSDNRPVVYVTLGTIHSGHAQLYECVARALATLPVRAVFGMGDWRNSGGFPSLPGSPELLGFAPQQGILSYAALCISHGGCNSAIEALHFGVPQLAIPLTNDQPGIGARIGASGAGIVLPLKKAMILAIKSTVERLLHDKSYADRAAAFKKEIEAAGGVRRAVDLIEETVIRMERPV